MKIAVISTGRSRCTLVANYLHTLYNDLSFEEEFYTEATWLGNLNLDSLTDQLMSKENFIVKIMSMNFFEGYDPSVFRLENYDQIHLVEREDFFEQCCSWHVSRSYNLYHLENDELEHNVPAWRVNNPTSGRKEFELLRKQKDKVTLEFTKEYARYVDRYLEIKRYLVKNNIAYTLHTYESAKEFDQKQSIIQDGKLNYKEMITNYHLKDDVNALFQKYFSYEHMTSDLKSFNKELSELRGFRTLQSFAKTVAAQWNE